MSKAGTQVIEVGVISADATLLHHVKKLCQEFDYSFSSWLNLEQFMNADPDCLVVITNSSEHKGSSQDNAAECCQAAKGICNDAFVVCIVHKTIKKEQLTFLKKSGADLILLDHQLTEMSKLEFLLTQQLKARFIPIKASELSPDSTIFFSILHLIQHRSKFLPCALPGLLTAEHLSKLSRASELYINRRDLHEFRKYLENRPSRSSKDLISRCRIRFLCLCATYAELVLLLTDQAESATLDKGSALLAQCRSLCSNLVSNIAEFEDVWEVIDTSAIGNMGSVERSTAVATYVATFGLRMDIDNLPDAMIGALLCDIGLILLNSDILKKIKLNLPLNTEEYTQYILHPLNSIELALASRIQLNTTLRKIIEMTHERYDQKGFPNQSPPNRISLESQLIQFCKELDTRTLVKLGELKRNPRMIREQWIQESIADTKQFSPEFCRQLKMTWGHISDDSITAHKEDRPIPALDQGPDVGEPVAQHLLKLDIKKP
jgi:response regulator RpfG family c-di-GMP phosphodiesterase